MGERHNLAIEVQHLLDELCVELGFCLPSTEQQRLLNAPLRDADAFTNAVFAAEGMDPSFYPSLHARVRERIARRIPTWIHESED